MYKGEKIIYLHLQKTGGLHITNLLSEMIPGVKGELHERLPDNQVPEGKLITGSVRNPWDWYVSLWAFGCENNGHIRELLLSRNYRQYPKMKKNRPLSWLGFITLESLKPVGRYRKLYADINNPGNFREWLSLVLDSRHRFDTGEYYGISSISRFAGLLTFRYMRLYARNHRLLFRNGLIRDMESLYQFDKEQNILDFTIRNENLLADLITALKKAGYELSAEYENKINNSGRTNQSGHRSAVEYYDQETKELVAEKEKFIIEKYNYNWHNSQQLHGNTGK